MMCLADRSLPSGSKSRFTNKPNHHPGTIKYVGDTILSTRCIESKLVNLHRTSFQPLNYDHVFFVNKLLLE